MRSFTILTALLFIVGLFLVLLYNEIGDCKDTYLLAAIVCVLVSILPPMFYRSTLVPRKAVIVVHITSVTVASHLLSVVWAEIDHGTCKAKVGKDTALAYASVVIVSYALMTVAGHFMKRDKKKGEEGYEGLSREDL